MKQPESDPQRKTTRSSWCQRSGFQPDKQGNAGPAPHVVPSVIEIGKWFTKRGDCQFRTRQSRRASRQRLRPSGEMHPQAVALLHAVEALPAKIGAFENERRVCFRTDKATMIREGMHDRDDKTRRRAHDTPNFL